jgi:hypothetical protein
MGCEFVDTLEYVVSVPASLPRADFELMHYRYGTDWKALSTKIVRIEDMIITLNRILKLGKKI